MARISRRQLKEDKLVSTTAKISIFFSEHWKKIAVVVLIVIFLIGVLVGFYEYKVWQNESASRILNEAKTLYAEADSAIEKDGKTQATIANYQEARAKFQEAYEKGGHKFTSSEALFYSAKCSYQIGGYSEAISDFQKIVSKYSKSPVAPYARQGIGQCYEQMDDSESLRKAIQQYDELSKYPESYISLKAFIDEGRCYEKLGEWNNALSAYNVIIERFKAKVESAIQAESKAMVEKAKDVISKHESILGKGEPNSDFQNYIDKAKAYEKDGQRWFEALKMYDRAIFSRNEYWYQQKTTGEPSPALQEAEKALREYEERATSMIKNIDIGRELAEQGDLDDAFGYYNRSVRFNFLPGMDLYEEAQLRVDWINSVEKQSMVILHIMEIQEAQAK